jgi:hypothetical protein
VTDDNQHKLPASLVPEKLRSRRRLIYIVGALYFLILFATVLWLFIQVIAPRFNLPDKELIYVAIFVAFIFLGMMVIITLWTKYLFKKNPIPRDGLTEKSSLHWQNKYSDTMIKNLPRMLFILVGFTLLSIVVFVLVVYFLS